MSCKAPPHATAALGWRMRSARRRRVIFSALATLQIRRELLDLARHYFGPQGTGANHASHGRDSEAGPLDRADSAAEPSKQAEWCEFHRIIDTLPQESAMWSASFTIMGWPRPRPPRSLAFPCAPVSARRWHSSLLELHKVLKSSYLES